MDSKTQLYTWIGKRIATFRHEKELSQTDLAKLMGLSRGSIANIEKGRQQTSLHVLWDIASNLELSIDSIIPLKNEHLQDDTDELIVNKTPGLNTGNKEFLSQFLKKNF